MPMFIGEKMSTQTLAPTMKEQLKGVVARELEVLEIGETAFGIGKATRIFLDAPTAVLHDVWDNLTKQNDANKGIVLSGYIAARGGIPISFLVPAQMQADLAEVFESFEVTPDTELMFGRLVALKNRLKDERETAEAAAIADGSIAAAKVKTLLTTFANQKAKGVRYTEEQKQALLAAM